VIVLGVTLAVGLRLASSRGAIALLPVLPALALAAPQLTVRPRWSLLVATVLLGTATVVWMRGRHPGALPDDSSAGDAALPDPPLATPR
jgi:hypothetical protein